MDGLAKQNLGTAETVLPVIGAAVASFNGWLSRSGARTALIFSIVIGILLIGRGIINW